MIHSFQLVIGKGLASKMVIDDLVGLDDGHGEIADGKLSDVTEPKEVILAFSSSGGINDVVTVLEWLPTACDKTHQCMEHPTSLTNPNPRPPALEPLFPMGAFRNMP